MNSSQSIAAVKDGSTERKIPSAWRPVFQDIVSAIIEKDYCLKSGIPGVEEVSVEIANHIENSIATCGATLNALPAETWCSSACMWYGSYCDALIDLCTHEEGISDLVLSVQVTENVNGFSFSVKMVYVP